MPLKEKLKTLVEKEINRATSKKLFESKEELAAMGDRELINLAKDSGIDELVVQDGEGNLTGDSRDEIIQSLCNLENSSDDIEEEVELVDEIDMGQADRTLRRSGTGKESVGRWGIKVDGKPSVNYFSSEQEARKMANEWKRLPRAKGKNIEVFKSSNADMNEEIELDEAERKVSPYDAHEFLSSKGWIGKDFFTLSSSEVSELLAYAKQVKYRAGKYAPGSTARMFFYYLTNLARKWETKNGKQIQENDEGIGNMNYDDKFFVFDNGGEEAEYGSMDRYTIILKADVDGEPDRRGMIPALASGKDPRGYMQHIDLYLSDVVDLITNDEVLTDGEPFLGKEIPFSSLPEPVQKFALNDYKDELSQTDDINEADEDDDKELDSDAEPIDGEEDINTDNEEESEDTEESDPEKITVVVISPELKKNDDDDDENQDSYDLENKNLINTNEHVAALFDGETLTESFQEKAKVIFESALAEHTRALRDKFVKEFRIRESKIKARFDTQVREVKEGLIKEQAKIIDGYLSEAVDTWVSENQMVLESNIRTELTEEFIDGLKNLFTESYIEVPAEKFDLIKAQEEKINELEESLQVEKKRSRQSLKEAKRLHCESIINKQTSQMTEVEKAKFIKLVESLEFDSIEQFERKVKVLKESYIRKTSILKEKTENKGVNKNNKIETSVIIEEEDQSKSPIDQISNALGSVLSTLK